MVLGGTNIGWYTDLERKNKTAMIPDEQSHDGIGMQQESCQKVNKWGVFCDEFRLRSPVVQKETVSDGNCSCLYRGT